MPIAKVTLKSQEPKRLDAWCRRCWGHSVVEYKVSKKTILLRKMAEKKGLIAENRILPKGSSGVGTDREIIRKGH